MGKSTIIFWQYNRYCNRKMAKYILNFNQEKALNNTFQEIYSESQNSWHFPDIITQKNILFLSTLLHGNNAFKNSVNKNRQYNRC